MAFLKEFKEFALKGNVMDMAVGVIIGGAFGKTFHKMQKSRYGTKKERHGGGPEPILSVPGTKRQKVVYFVENTGIFSYFCS